jgi:hypothetical protein
LNLFVIDDPAVGAGVVVGRPESTARMILRVCSQPFTQRGVRILWRGRDGFVTLGGAMLPGHPAGKSFADPQHALEMANGCPTVFRA